MRSRSTRVLWLCVLAGCAGGPISDFPFAGGDDSPSGGGFGGGGPRPPSAEDPDTGSAGPNDPSEPSVPGSPDGETPDAGVSTREAELPCGLWPDAGVDGDAGVVPDAFQQGTEACQGDHCGLTLSELRASIAADAVCFTALREVCENRLQVAASSCAQSLLGLTSPLCERVVLGVDTPSDACLSCYVEAERCTAQQCAAECAAAGNEACGACRSEKCAPALSLCTGLLEP